MLLLILLLFVLAILTVVFLLLWAITKKKLFGKLTGCLWIGFFGFIGFLFLVDIFTSKKQIEKEDIYGSYIIDRHICPGKQADWQYNHYRFTITEDNKIHFFITEKDKIVKTIEGKVKINEFYTPSPRLKIIFDEPRFHIIQDNPTLYREIWSFYYVFYSDKYQNVFFTKGDWSSID